MLCVLSIHNSIKSFFQLLGLRCSSWLQIVVLCVCSNGWDLHCCLLKRP